MRDFPLNNAETGTRASIQVPPPLEPAEKGSACSAHDMPLFENPFSIEDLLVFDDTTMQRMLRCDGFGLTLEDLSWSLHNATSPFVKRFKRNLPSRRQAYFLQELQRPVTAEQVKAARQRVLDRLFWELTYWKMPELYEELTEGEQAAIQVFFNNWHKIYEGK